MKYPELKVAYLGTCYTHPDSEERMQRTHNADMVAAELMARGLVVFSPISHGHRVAQTLSEHLVNSHAFWMAQCLPMVRRSDIFVVLPQHGWRTSKGLAEEIQCCVEYGIPIFVYQDSSDKSIEILDQEELEILNYRLLPDDWYNLTTFLNQPTSKL